MGYRSQIKLEFSGIIEASTPKAVFFQDWFWEEPKWMPKSQIEITRSPDWYEVVVKASDWICGKNEITETFDERTTSTD